MCNQQTSLIAGPLIHSTRLPLTTWFLAISLVNQSKNNLSALSLKRQLGLCYRTAWRMKHKLMEAMACLENRYTLEGRIEFDDAYLGGEHTGEKRGRCSENKIPFVAAWSTNEDGHPMYAKLSPVSGWFTQEAFEVLGTGIPGAGEHRHIGSSGLLYRPFCADFSLPGKNGRPKTQGSSLVSLGQYHSGKSEVVSVWNLSCV